MNDDTRSPIRSTDDEARTLARKLLSTARFAALGVVHPETNTPMVTRIGLGTSLNGSPLTLISSLSLHTKALRKASSASLLVGEPAEKGDPLTHPRLTLQVEARFVERSSAQHDGFREHYLTQHPKAQLYIDFTDFTFVRFNLCEAYLNAGFGKAFHLFPKDFEV